MAGRIDYQIEKYQFTDLNEDPRITRQWAEVMAECRENRANSEERLRTALLNVDYVTSFELPFRLLLIRTPQLIAGMRESLAIGQKSVVFNDKRFGCVYSLKRGLDAVPDAFHYRLSNRIRRVEADGTDASPFQQIAKETRAPRERLKIALESGLSVTALDGMFWFGIQRMAADVLRLRKSGMGIMTAETEVSDSLTGTTRLVPLYRLAGR